MAMSDTAGSSFPHWAGLYQHEPSPVLTVDASAVATGGAASPTSGGSGGSPTKSSPQRQQLGVEGPRAAIGKPAARRRSRASRRAPVTLLNTDAANFRAMVQQFTGIPPPPAGAAFPGGAPLISFAGGDYGFPAPAGVMAFDHHHHHLHRSHAHAAAAPPLHDQLLFRPQPQQPYTGAAAFGSYGNAALHGAGAGAGDMFASAEDRMLLQSMQAAQMPPASAAHNGGANGYFA
ncbi:hypothetical protein ACP4OV_013575 [Aristida adscensionis]